MEILDIVDEYGQPTGEVVDRETAHAEGIRHRTSHVWIVRRQNDKMQILLQKRSDNKDSNPGCYDVSSAGHIPAGENYLNSAVRELKEELGVECDEKQLIFCGQRRYFHQKEFYGKPFNDRQVSNVYVLWLDREPEDFSLQESEVSQVKWIDLDECISAVENNVFPHCISGGELAILKRSLKKTVEIIMLGTGHATVTKCYNSCFALKKDQEYFLVDAGGGNGILSQLEKAKIPIWDISHMFITHCHTDHILGAPWIIRMVAAAMISHKYQGEFNIYGHEKALQSLKEICNITFGKKFLSVMEKRMNFVVLENGQSFTALNLSCTAFDIFSTKEKQFGFSMELPDKRKFSYLGDEPYNPKTRAYVYNSSYLLCEAFCLKKDAERYKPYEKCHSTAYDAGYTAEKLQVENLILFHTEDDNLNKRKELYKAEAKEKFMGNVFVPEDLERWIM